MLTKERKKHHKTVGHVLGHCTSLLDRQPLEQPRGTRSAYSWVNSRLWLSKPHENADKEPRAAASRHPVPPQ